MGERGMKGWRKGGREGERDEGSGESEEGLRAEGERERETEGGNVCDLV